MKYNYLNTFLLLTLIYTNPIYGNKPFFNFLKSFVGFKLCSFLAKPEGVYPDATSQSHNRSFISLAFLPITGIWSLIRASCLPATKYHRQQRDNKIQEMDTLFKEEYQKDFFSLKEEIAKDITGLKQRIEELQKTVISYNNEERDQITGLEQTVSRIPSILKDQALQFTQLNNELNKTSKEVDENNQSLSRILKLAQFAQNNSTFKYRGYYGQNTVPYRLSVLQ